MSLTYTLKPGSNFTPSGILQNLPNAKRPRHGWGVRFTSKGFTTPIQGETARSVFARSKAHFDLNGIPYTDEDLWLNLGIQWLDRMPGKAVAHVPLETFLANAVATAGEDIPTVTRKRSYTPKQWGPKGWAMLQMYLAQDVYSYDTFLVLAAELAAWVNPAINPSIGCGECYQHFTGALTDLRSHPRHKQEEAREWLFNAMNSVHVRNQRQPWTKERAYKSNFWT